MQHNSDAITIKAIDSIEFVNQLVSDGICGHQ